MAIGDMKVRDRSSVRIASLRRGRGRIAGGSRAGAFCASTHALAGRGASRGTTPKSMNTHLATLVQPRSQEHRPFAVRPPRMACPSPFGPSCSTSSSLRSILLHPTMQYTIAARMHQIFLQISILGPLGLDCVSTGSRNTASRANPHAAFVHI